MWSVNNYLGLAGNEEIKQVAADAIQRYSVSSPMGSRMMSGNTDEHLALERQLADYAGTEAAILFNYGLDETAFDQAIDSAAVLYNIPEPASAAVMLVGLGLLGRRRH